jgi:hypothetical protein
MSECTSFLVQERTTQPTLLQNTHITPAQHNHNLDYLAHFNAPLSVYELEDARGENVGYFVYRVVLDMSMIGPRVGWKMEAYRCQIDPYNYGLPIIHLSIVVGVVFAFQRIPRYALLFSTVVGNTRPNIHRI